MMVFIRFWRSLTNKNCVMSVRYETSGLPELPIFEIYGSGSSSRQIPAPGPTPTPSPSRHSHT